MEVLFVIENGAYSEVINCLKHEFGGVTVGYGVSYYATGVTYVNLTITNDKLKNAILEKTLEMKGLIGIYVKY